MGGLATLVLPVTAHAAAWSLIDTDRGVRVYEKDVPGSPLVAFRGEAVFDAPIDRILWVLADNDHRTEWVDRLKRSVVLQKNSRYDYVLYQHFELPPVISDRDYVYRGRVTHSNATGKVTLHLASVEHPNAPPTVGVRARLIGSSYVLTPVSKTRTHVQVEIHTDPKGWLPSWLVNMIQKSWPMKTLVAMREQVAKPHVGSLAPPPAQ